VRGKGREQHKVTKILRPLKNLKISLLFNPISPYRFKAIIAKSAAEGCKIKVYTLSTSSSCAYTYGSEISGKLCSLYLDKVLTKVDGGQLLELLFLNFPGSCCYRGYWRFSKGFLVRIFDG
jgi:hypothetical protein